MNSGVLITLSMLAGVGVYFLLTVAGILGSLATL